MKKRMAIVLAAAMVFGLTACANTASEESAPEGTALETEQEAESEQSMESEQLVGLANPWSDVDTATEAAEGAGVGYFVVPADGTDTDAGMINWDTFRYMDRLAEAQGAIGAAEITVRKGLSEDSDDVSGDYTVYDYEWQLEADGWLVNCSGNVDGQAMLMTWTSDNFSYSIMIRGQGDDAETYGIDEYMVNTLVSGIQ